MTDVAEEEEEVDPMVDDEDVEDTADPLFESCDETVPLISFDLTISCLASLVFVPGLVRLIFILRPLSTVAECSTAILPGLPALLCTAFTPLTILEVCLLPGPVITAELPLTLPVLPLLPALFVLPLPGLLERAEEFTQEEDDDDEDDDEDDEEDDNDN